MLTLPGAQAACDHALEEAQSHQLVIVPLNYKLSVYAIADHDSGLLTVASLRASVEPAACDCSLSTGLHSLELLASSPSKHWLVAASPQCYLNPQVHSPVRRNYQDKRFVSSQLLSYAAMSRSYAKSLFTHQSRLRAVCS
jgi:hypothetical protein